MANPHEISRITEAMAGPFDPPEGYQQPTLAGWKDVSPLQIKYLPGKLLKELADHCYTLKDDVPEARNQWILFQTYHKRRGQLVNSVSAKRSRVKKVAELVFFQTLAETFGCPAGAVYTGGGSETESAESLGTRNAEIWVAKYAPRWVGAARKAAVSRMRKAEQIPGPQPAEARAMQAVMGLMDGCGGSTDEEVAVGEAGLMVSVEGDEAYNDDPHAQYDVEAEGQEQEGEEEEIGEEMEDSEMELDDEDEGYCDNNDNHAAGYGRSRQERTHQVVTRSRYSATLSSLGMQPRRLYNSSSMDDGGVGAGSTAASAPGPSTLYGYRKQ